MHRLGMPAGQNCSPCFPIKWGHHSDATENGIIWRSFWLRERCSITAMIQIPVTVSPTCFFVPSWLLVVYLTLPIPLGFSVRWDRSDLPKECSRMLRKLDANLDSLFPTRETMDAPVRHCACWKEGQHSLSETTALSILMWLLAVFAL